MDIQQRIIQTDWTIVQSEIDHKGYSLIPSILTDVECDVLIKEFDNDELYRKTINMEQYRYGIGEYKYYSYPLPAIIQNLREHIYPQLAPLANSWMQVLNLQKQYPQNLIEWLEVCHRAGQERPTPLILRYERGGYNALHHDLYGEIYFPFQLVVCLSSPERDYEGGEFVLIEQKPRAQSKAIVLHPNKGDLLIFTTNSRPVKGAKGYYRVNMKHGVSEVTEGNRFTLGVIFHDAL